MMVYSDISETIIIEELIVVSLPAVFVLSETPIGQTFTQIRIVKLLITWMRKAII